MKQAHVELVERHLDDTLSAADAEELLKLLRSDGEFRKEFVRAVRTHGLLSAGIGPDASGDALADVVAVALPVGSRALESKVMEKIAGRSPRRRPLWLILGSIAACLALAAGIRFWTADRGVVVEALGGPAFRISDGRETPLSPGESLRPGEGLRSESGAVLTWRDGTRVELEADTRLGRIEEGASGSRVFLARGALAAHVARQKHPMRFATPQGEARVLGTILRLATDPKGGTRLEVEQGKVELANTSGKTVLVEGGRFAVAAPGVDLVSRKLEPGWTNVTGAVGGDVWGFGGVHTMSAVPGHDEVLAGISEAGLWSTRDGGASWGRLGDFGKGRPWRIVFDPADAKRFWVSATYGGGIFATSDGGASFRRLGALRHVDGLAVDFSDPARRTLLATLHWTPGGLHRSRDGGETWEKIGDRLPAGEKIPSEVLILDAKTFVTNSIRPHAIYRSSDAGETWSTVSSHGPNGPALAASDGALYWQGLYGSGLLRSLDRGAVWTRLDGPVRTNVIELPDGRLAGTGGRRLFVSEDKGLTWSSTGPALPIVPAGLVYQASRRSFFVWQTHEPKIPDAIFRWTVPE